MLKFAKDIKAHNAGATALEFALLLGPLLLFIFGIIEVSRFYYSQHELVNIADRLSRQIILNNTGELLSNWPGLVAEAAVLLDPDRISVTQSMSVIAGISYHQLDLGYEFSYLVPLVGTGTQTLRYQRTIPITGF